jgi:ornithine carbamoyltransferase
MKRDLISFAAWTADQLTSLFVLTRRLKTGALSEYTPLAQKSVALIFETESLRTRVSFEVGVARLGGHPIFLQQETIGLATRESVHDIGQVLSQYCHLIVARTTKHQTCVQLSESATVPVINAMTDLVHPCQILADAFTLQEMGRLSPKSRIVFVGDGNNIANTWLEFAEKIPLHLVFSCPPGYEPHPQILEQTQSSGMSTIEFSADPMEAVKDADVIYTDVWPDTRGGVDEGRRSQIFKPFQVNKSLLQKARPDHVVMHRLPANRGEEITSEVLDGKHSIVLPQAENRLHIQNGIMGYLLSPLTV